MIGLVLAAAVIGLAVIAVVHLVTLLVKAVLLGLVVLALVAYLSRGQRPRPHRRRW